MSVDNESKVIFFTLWIAFFGMAAAIGFGFLH